MLERDNVIIAITFLLRVQKKCRNIYLAVQEKLDLLFRLIMEKTTTGNVVFFDAKMYVVSYCMILAFHPELTITRLVIFRTYDQNPNPLISLTHF